MREHLSSFPEDEDGWTHVRCECGFAVGPVPDMEIAADVWGGHCAEVAFDAAVARAVKAETALAAAHRVLHHAIEQWAPHAIRAVGGDRGFPHEWTESDWADSAWDDAEAAAIRTATGTDQ